MSNEISAICRNNLLRFGTLANMRDTFLAESLPGLSKSVEGDAGQKVTRTADHDSTLSRPENTCSNTTSRRSEIHEPYRAVSIVRVQRCGVDTAIQAVNLLF